MAANQDDRERPLRYGDLESAAKAIDDFRRRVEAHPSIERVDYGDGDGDGDGESHVYHAFVTVPIPTKGMRESDVKRILKELWRTGADANVDGDGIRVMYSTDAFIGNYDSVREYVLMLRRLLEMANDTQKHAQAIMNHPTISKLIRKYEIP